MKFFKCLFLLLILFQVSASKLHWQPKREIGDTTIWKNTQDKSIRASTQIIKSEKSYFADLEDRESFVKSLETKKREGMKFLGIKDWRANNYSWDAKTLTITGEYIDRKNKKNFFYERHTFIKGKRVISLVTSTKKNSLNTKVANEFFKTTLDWESRR